MGEKLPIVYVWGFVGDAVGIDCPDKIGSDQRWRAPYTASLYSLSADGLDVLP